MNRDTDQRHRIESVKASIDEAQADYFAKYGSADASEAGASVKVLRKALAELLAEGAEPCAECKVPAHGMEQPRPGGGVEYEVGCLGCGASARGGVLPRHAVEAWNAGVRKERK